MRPPVRRYDLQRFINLTRWTWTQVQEVAPCNGEEWKKRREFGVTEQAADRIACAAGWHPHEVWPEMLADAIADLPDKDCDECGETFIPNRPSFQRFCSKRCYRRHHGRNSMQRRRADPVEAEKNRERRRAYYAENAEYERARERRRYYEKKGAA